MSVDFADPMVMENDWLNTDQEHPGSSQQSQRTVAELVRLRKHAGNSAVPSLPEENATMLHLHIGHPPSALLLPESTNDSTQHPEDRNPGELSGVLGEHSDAENAMSGTQSGRPILSGTESVVSDLHGLQLALRRSPQPPPTLETVRSNIVAVHHSPPPPMSAQGATPNLTPTGLTAQSDSRTAALSYSQATQQSTKSGVPVLESSQSSGHLQDLHSTDQEQTRNSIVASVRKKSPIQRVKAGQ